MRPPILNTGERILVAVAASRQDANAVRVVGGRVFLTTQRLLHRPGLADRLVRATSWESSLTDIRGVEAGHRLTGFVGGMGQSVTVTVASGSNTEFRVWRGNQLAESISAAITGAAGQT